MGSAGEGEMGRLKYVDASKRLGGRNHFASNGSMPEA